MGLWQRFRGWPLWAQALIVLVLVGIIAGAASGHSKTTPTAAITATPTTTTTSPQSPSLTGFGATTAAWDGAHTAVSGFAPGAVYDADPSLPKVNGHEGAHYAAVLHENGHVLNYEYRFTNRPIAAAETLVLHTEFPADAKIAWFVVKQTCAQMLVTSATVAKALGTKAIGDTAGAALVEFSSGINDYSYNPKAVNDALLMISSSIPKSQSPGC